MNIISLLKSNGKLSALISFIALIAMFHSNKATAQAFCNNEQVLWSEDFGTGTVAVSNPNVINLSYQAINNLELDGTYRMAERADQNSGWHKGIDHTPGDVDGNMIVTNAKTGEFYQKTLVRNTGYAAGFYAFSFFVTNVDEPGFCNPVPLLPVISIKIEYLDANNNWVALQNSPITTAAVPETATLTWYQRGGIFVLPVTGNFLVTTFRFTLSDDAASGCGNDFALDDIKFSTCSDDGPVPVHFLNIAAQKKGTGVNISWATSTELNNDYFEVERSTDGGATWTTISRRSSYGTSSSTRNYAAYDAKPASGANYYRIKQVDKDGAFRYSTTVVYKLTIETTDVSVLANPFNQFITVDFLSNRSQSVNARLFDNTGRLLISQVMPVGKGNTRNSIQASNLSRGMYLLQVTDDNGQVIYSQKLVKQ